MSLSDKNYIRKVFIKYGNKVRFKVGQSLSSDSYISGNVNFIESGEARIIFNDNGRLKTVSKVSFGEVIGAISLIRNKSCENVRASKEIIAISLNDREFQNLYKNDQKFRSFFEEKNYPSEIIEFSKSLLNLIPNSKYGILDLYKLISSQKYFFSEQAEDISSLYKEDKNLIFLSTLIKDKEIYERINNISDFLNLKTLKTDYLKRFIKIDKKLFDKINQDKTIEKNKNTKEN